MRHYSFYVIVIAIPLTISAAAQNVEVPQPPSVREVIGALLPDDAGIAAVFTRNEAPLGPRDILQAYEQQMVVAALDTCESLSQIATAYRLGNLSDSQAEYATRETYALGLMQFQLLSTLHDILNYKIEKDEKDGERVPRLDQAHGAGVPSGTSAASWESQH
jgi:hypothetical protein